MVKKFTYEYVKNYIEVESGSGCILLSENYINSMTKLKVKCKCGNIYNVTWNSFRNNSHRCRKCNNKRGFHHYDYDYVKKYIEIDSESGCKLISKTYNSSLDKLTMQCKCGNVFKKSWNNFHKIKNTYLQCSECGYKMRSKNRIGFKYEDVKKYIEIESESGCKLISEQYIDSKTKLKIQCKCGNIFYKSLSAFKNQKKQCPSCSSKKARCKC